MPFPTGARSQTDWIPAFSKQDPRLEIRIEQHDDTKIYTSGSIIAGCVTVISKNSMLFDRFDISLTGTTYTCLSTYHNDFSVTKHRFLRLSMPSPITAIPENRIFQAGQTCRIPFEFVIPNELPSAACKFPTILATYDQHLQLPPTLGFWDGKDQSLGSAQIEYVIKVQAVSKEHGSAKPKSIEIQQQINVIPISFDRPKLHASPNDTAPDTKKAKMIRQNLLSPQIGKLSATINHSYAVQLSVQRLETSGTSLWVDLEFLPKSKEATLPDIQVRSAHIQVATHVSRSHISYLPDKSHETIQMAPTIPHTVSNELVVKKGESLLWEPQVSTNAAQGVYDGEGPVTSNACADGVSSDSGLIKYKAAMKVHISIPSDTKKLYLPSFYSCLVCRTYTLRLVLAAGPSGTTLSLRTPLQIVATEPGVDTTLGLPSYIQQDPATSSDSAMPPSYDDLLA